MQGNGARKRKRSSSSLSKNSEDSDSSLDDTPRTTKRKSKFLTVYDSEDDAFRQEKRKEKYIKSSLMKVRNCALETKLHLRV